MHLLSQVSFTYSACDGIKCTLIFCWTCIIQIPHQIPSGASDDEAVRIFVEFARVESSIKGMHAIEEIGLLITCLVSSVIVKYKDDTMLHCLLCVILFHLPQICVPCYTVCTL